MSNEPTSKNTKPNRGGRPHDEAISERILTVGTELLNRDGYAGLSIGEVARQVGCGKAALYRRYSGKPALVAAIIESHAKLGEMPSSGSLREDLLAHALQNQANQDGLGFTSGHGMQAMFEPEVYPILWSSVFQQRRERGRAIIEQGVLRGEVDADIDADVVLDVLAGLTMYRQTIKGIHVEREHYLKVIDALIALPPKRTTSPQATEPSPALANDGEPPLSNGGDED